MVAISTGDMTRDLKQNLLIQSFKKISPLIGAFCTILS